MVRGSQISNQKKVVIASVIITSIASIMALWVAFAQYQSAPPIESLRYESEIRRVAFGAIARASRAKSDAGFEGYAKYISEILTKLAGGWSGFESDRYHPSGFTEQSLAGQIYGEIARVATREQGPRQEELRSLLFRLRPSNEAFCETWEKTLRLYGIPPE